MDLSSLLNLHQACTDSVDPRFTQLQPVGLNRAHMLLKLFGHENPKVRMWCTFELQNCFLEYQVTKLVFMQREMTFIFTVSPVCECQNQSLLYVYKCQVINNAFFLCFGVISLIE